FAAYPKAYLICHLFFLILLQPPISPLFPYTTLFRSTFGTNGITHFSGKTVTFTRNSTDRIAQINDPTGNSMFYTYSVVGDLISLDRKSTRLNSSHVAISYAVFCLKKKK